MNNNGHIHIFNVIIQIVYVYLGSKEILIVLDVKIFPYNKN